MALFISHIGTSARQFSDSPPLGGSEGAGFIFVNSAISFSLDILLCRPFLHITAAQCGKLPVENPVDNVENPANSHFTIYLQASHFAYCFVYKLYKKHYRPRRGGLPKEIVLCLRGRPPAAHFPLVEKVGQRHPGGRATGIYNALPAHPPDPLGVRPAAVEFNESARLDSSFSPVRSLRVATNGAHWRAPRAMTTFPDLIVVAIQVPCERPHRLTAPH